MTILKFDPRLVGLAFEGLATRPRRVEKPQSWVPAVDVSETADHFLIRAELAGMSADQIEIRLDDGRLEIGGFRETGSEPRQERAWLRERPSGSFSRRFVLPQQADTARIVASYRNGVLEVTVPKSAAAKPRRIAVTAARDSRRPAHGALY
jgi:HSP20 family protein